MTKFLGLWGRRKRLGACSAACVLGAPCAGCIRDARAPACTRSAVGLLTSGLINRSDYYEHAMLLALIPFMKRELYAATPGSG